MSCECKLKVSITGDAGFRFLGLLGNDTEHLHYPVNAVSSPQ